MSVHYLLISGHPGMHAWAIAQARCHCTDHRMVKSLRLCMRPAPLETASDDIFPPDDEKGD